MKKKILLLGFAALFCSVQYSFAGDANSAQNINPVKIACFEADGAIVYDVSGCVPGSDISFYSTKGGGAMMRELLADANGSAKVVWSQKTLPAFVLNASNKNAAGIAGNGMVTFTGDKEFTVNNVALDNNSGNVTVRWNGSVNKSGSYAFEVLKSVNNSGWSVIQTVSAQSAEVLPYSFTDVSQTNGTAVYQVRVVNTGNEIHYTSNPLYADGGTGISVYPTVAQSTVNVVLSSATNSGYRIMNMNGQVVISGSLNIGQNACPVSGLPAGNYLIEVSNAGNKTTAKFVKE